MTAYPVEELGGLIFAYLGPQPAPLLPRWDLFAWDNLVRAIASTVIPCNWRQCMENSADSVHAEYLHGHYFRYVLARKGVHKPEYPRSFLRHHIRRAYEQYEYGMIKRRIVEGDTEEAEDWRIGHPLIFPNMARLGGRGGQWEFQIRVPLDDTHTWHICYEAYAPPGVNVPPQEVVPMYDVPLKDERGDWITDYVLGQDMMGWWGQGEIADRSDEKLGASDKGVIVFRKMLKEQMELVERGGEPMNVFRAPAKNRCIELGRGERDGALQGARTDTLRRRQQRFNPILPEIEALFASSDARS